MKIEHRAQSTDNRLKRIVWLSIACSFISVFFCLSSKAAPWEPEDVLKSFLVNNYPWEEIEVSNVKVAGRICDETPDRILIEKGPLGKAVFSFICKNNERAIVKADVRAFGWVVMSRMSFERGHVIRDEDTYLAKMDIGKMPRSSVKDPAGILGRSLKRSIIANMPVVEDMIEMSRIVARGKIVELVLDFNGLSIKTAGKTKEKGYVGMPVKAINISSKKEVTGVLIDENTIRVDL
ncbi:MAG: flagellar basal body P-ring formation protein FlgA [Nitrospirae bacterium]|nr:flagellar basal body P-ring formation protein FlgA [Nitrospirota bacterium]